MDPATRHHIRLGGQRVPYRLVRSQAARKLRVRVGPAGVEVVQPAERSGSDVRKFLEANRGWILTEMGRVERLGRLKKPAPKRGAHLLFGGDPTAVCIEATGSQARGSTIRLEGGRIVIRRGALSRTPLARSLERWLRERARTAIEQELGHLYKRLHRSWAGIYVMGQRTKWGNCSSRGNLSFNWRLILAPGFVLRYLVTHEYVHLAIPDHSARFWLTVQSLCPESQRARQWLSRHEAELRVDLESLVAGSRARRAAAR